MSKNHMSFKDFFNEETTAGDIASVDTKLDMRTPKHLSKGKKCRKHKKINCSVCSAEKESKYE